ncbi:MAG: ABC transporter substrate-binding protein [Oligoflexia bacterium]|nr:ABC transporter substrate-binding protein [Oligoflexia bacterium]
MKNAIRNTVGAVLLGAFALSGAACKKAAPPSGSAGDGQGVAQTASGDVIRIGEVGSMTGSEATFGTSTHKGIELAVKQVNAAGGVRGKKIELISLDDQGKPDEAATAATKLITQNGVSAILGEVASSRSMAMAPIAQNHKVIMVSPSSTNPKVTELGDYVFRVCFIDPFQGTVMAKYALDNLKIKKVAILRDVKNDYSVGLANFFAETFKKGGGEIVIDQSYSAGDIDFKSQLTAIRAKAPEGIFVPGYYTEVGLIARQARELGVKVPLMGGDGWDSPKLKEIGGEAMNNSYFSNHYSSEDKSPVVQEFITQFKAAYNEVPDGLSAAGYDAAKILFDAMGRAKSLASNDIREALAATKDYPGVTGKIMIDEKRNAVKSAVVLKVENGEFRYQTTVNP